MIIETSKRTFFSSDITSFIKTSSCKNGNDVTVKKNVGFLENESEENQKYGRGFYETVASDLNYKKRFIHSFKCIYMLKDYPYFKESDFEYLRGKIQVLILEKDI